MTTLTDYLNPADYPALYSLPFAVFITGKEHTVNKALCDCILDDDESRWGWNPKHPADDGRGGLIDWIDWHYSEYEIELGMMVTPFVMIVQSLELIHVAFRVFGERMVLIRVDNVGDKYELVIYNHAALNAAIVTNREVR